MRKSFIFSIFHFLIFTLSTIKPAGLIVDQHRHHQHQHILVLRLLRGQHQSGTAGVSQLQDDILAVEVAQNLDERRTLETNAHGLTVVGARHALGSGLREVVVLGIQLRG